MSSRLRFELIVGIESVQVTNGTVTDPRYHSTLESCRLEDVQWQEMVVPLPPLPEKYRQIPSVERTQEEDWEWDRLCLLYDHLHDQRSSDGQLAYPVYKVLHWNAQCFPNLFGFTVQTSPNIEWIGFALASIDQKYAEAGYHVLPTYQGHYRYVSPSLPPYLQRLQREYWAYSSFADRMPGFFYCFKYLCDWIGFDLIAEDFEQVKLILLWEWT